MKKFWSLFLLFLLFGLTGCEYQNSKIDGMKVAYERINFVETKNYGLVDGDDIVVYVVATSGSYTPSVEDLVLEDGILDVEVKLKSKSQYATCDMALWKITIDSDEKYVSAIQSIEVNVERK